jgi:hypothetical protein
VPGGGLACTTTPRRSRSTTRKATPYPSTIDVAGESGVVTEVAVTLRRASRTRPSDVDVLLVSPDGDTSIVLPDSCGADPITNTT